MLEFVDTNGSSGRITSDLLLEYDGVWVDEVEAYFSDVIQECTEDDGDVDTETVIFELLVDLPGQIPVQNIQRRND